MMTNSHFEVEETLEGESARYRAVSPIAIIALILGMLSASSLLHPSGCAIALLGAVVSIVALNRIAASPELIGRKAALLGLALSIAFGVAAPAQALTTRWWLAGEAEPAALGWFRYLQDDKPELAHQMTQLYATRQQPDRVLDFYRSSPEAKENLTEFVADPLIRTLLALGDKAQIRLYETGDITFDKEGELIEQYYAVTYPDPRTRQPRTFFVRMDIDRLTHKGTGETRWRVISTRGGVRPPSQQ